VIDHYENPINNEHVSVEDNDKHLLESPGIYRSPLAAPTPTSYEELERIGMILTL